MKVKDILELGCQLKEREEARGYCGQDIPDPIVVR
jgi:hypothetical protein